MILRISANKAIEYLLEENIIADDAELKQIEQDIYNPKVRINEKTFDEFNENLNTQKVFKINI